MSKGWEWKEQRKILLHFSPQKLHTVHFIDSTLGMGVFVEFDESVQEAVTMASPLDFKTRDRTAVLEGFSKVKFGTKERKITNEHAAIGILKHGWLHGIERRKMSHVLCNFYFDWQTATWRRANTIEM